MSSHCTKRDSQPRILLRLRMHLKSTIYWIIKNFKEWSSIVVMKASGHPRKSSKGQDRLLRLIQLQDQGTTSAELAQKWQQAGVSVSACTLRQILFWKLPGVKKGSQKVTRKKHQGETYSSKRYRDWTAKDWGNLLWWIPFPIIYILSINTLFCHTDMKKVESKKI